MSDKMILHHAGLSPFARKVRVCALELGLADRIEERAVTVAPGRPNPEYAGQVNPLRRVPALTLADGTSLNDSTLICQYLDELAGHRLIPTEGDRRWRVLNAHAVATGMTEMTVQLRYEGFVRPEEKRWEPWSEDLTDKILAALDWFEARAGDGSSRPRAGPRRHRARVRGSATWTCATPESTGARAARGSPPSSSRCRHASRSRPPARRREPGRGEGRARRRHRRRAGAARALARARRHAPAGRGARAGRSWPVHLDHCFARVLLDDACGRPWREAIRRRRGATPRPRRSRGRSTRARRCSRARGISTR